MKIRFLIIIGISIVTAISLSYYAIYDSSTTVFISCDPRYEQIDDKCVLKISETDYEELECLRLYKDIREISRTDGMALAERETIDMHKSLVFEYVEKDCPDFPDLEFIYNNYKQNISEPEPERDSAWTTDAEDELYSLGCDKPILEHLLKYSNLLDDEFDGNYGIDDIGLEDGISQEKFEECVDYILEKRILELYKDTPEVIAFYDKYNDANVSVREDHVSYFAGNGDDFRVRMNLYFDENYDLTHMQFYCYVGGQLQHEVPQEDIVSHLQKYHCQTDSMRK